MPDKIFSSSSYFKQQFVQQLQKMTLIDEFGIFILVLANAISKPEIYHSLSTDLSNRFAFLKQKLSGLSVGEREQIPADDLSVFIALSRINFNQPSLSISKNSAIWQLQYNPLRSYRPARNSHKTIDKLYQPFDPDSFHLRAPL